MALKKLMPRVAGILVNAQGGHSGSALARLRRTRDAEIAFRAVLVWHSHLCASDEHGGHVVDGVDVFEGVAAHGHEVGILARLEGAGGVGDPAYLGRDCGEGLVPELVPESAPLDPRNTYAATKGHGEQLATIWSRETGGTVAALRFHNVYGPGMPRDTPYAGVASIFADSALRGEPPRVFEDGCQRRNFIHVSDVATAVIAAVHAPLPTQLTPLNIGTPWVTTVGAMARELSRRLGGPAPIVTGAYRLGDVRHITADCSAAEEVLGWRARIDITNGLADLSASMAAIATTDADKSA